MDDFQQLTLEAVDSGADRAVQFAQCRWLQALRLEPFQGEFVPVEGLRVIWQHVAGQPIAQACEVGTGRELIAEKAANHLAMPLALPAIEVICRQGGRVDANLFCQCFDDMWANRIWPFGIATIDLPEFELQGKA